jgi:hypothetical protein
VALLIAASPGCGGDRSGPERFEVSGRVTFGGEPIPKGVIIFSPDAGQGNSGPQGTARINDGSYSTGGTGGKGVTGGPHVVRIIGTDGKTFVDDVGNEYDDGRPLFDPWETNVDFAREAAVHDFDVPATAAGAE